MKQQIRHQRLHAFFESKVLNTLMLVIIAGLLIMGWSDTITLPGIIVGTALLFFIGYAIWFWFWKPNSVIVNTQLANITGIFALYFMLIVALKAKNEWWYILPLFGMMCTLFIVLIGNKDRTVEL